jgi:enamine deaminase RidA (YjgF/YER057c/UK114 family)
MNYEEKLSTLGINLPPAPVAAGLYKPMLIVDDLVYLSGHLPILEDGNILVGEVGNDCTVEEGSGAARQVGLNMLATLLDGLGSLDRIARVVKLLGMVNAGNEFTQHPQVINGCSELLKDVLGNDCGVGTRSAFGVSGLPAGAMVEIEGIFQIKE